MFKNYFYLLRSAFELNGSLGDSTIVDIYSQEKDLLFLSIPTQINPDQHLVISTNQQFPYLVVKSNHRKAKRNVAHFFEQFLPLKLISIQISESDRLIKLSLDKGSLYFAVRGNKTNIHFISKTGEEELFKKTNNSLIDEVSKHSFSSELEFKNIDYNEKNFKNLTDVKKKYPMIIKEISNEILSRENITTPLPFTDHLKDIINEILHNNINVGYSQEMEKVVFYPNSFNSMSTKELSKEFDNFNSALQYYISTFYRQFSKKNYSKELDNYFDKELSKKANKLNKLKGRIEAGSNDKKYYAYGNYLLANIHNLKKGMENISITDYSNKDELLINLDPKLAPKENIDRYFEKAKDEKLNFNKSLELFNLTKENYDSLKSDYEYFKSLNSIKEIETLYNRIIKKREKKITMDSGLKFKYWHYKIDEQYHVYVGRDSKSNDYLSIKFSNQNDYWFHARGLPGSHVVLRVDNVKEGVPKDIIKKTASIAAYHSKAKTAGTAPVSYTFAKFVHKKKGMAPGKVLLSKENSLLVKPCIPKNCELINE